MSHTADFKLVKVERNLSTAIQAKFNCFTFEDSETESEIQIDTWVDKNEIKRVYIVIRNYERFNSGLDDVIDDVIKKVKALEGIEN